jgi:uncharacterized membrane protein (DUF106 family)
MVFEFIGNSLDFMLSPLLNMPPFWAIAIIAFILSVLITVIYKFTTNQKELKVLKEETKTLQTEIKQAQGDVQKMTDLNQKLLANTGKQLKHTFRSYIFTFLPVILIFGWMQGHIAYYPIMPDQTFTTTAVFKDTAEGNITLSAPDLQLLSQPSQESTGTVTWKLKGSAGSYNLEYSYGKEIFQRKVIISTEWKYTNQAPTSGIQRGSDITSINVNLDPVRPFGFSLFGWQPGWFATYFILTMLFTFPIRKVLKVY